MKNAVTDKNERTAPVAVYRSPTDDLRFFCMPRVCLSCRSFDAWHFGVGVNTKSQ